MRKWWAAGALGLALAVAVAWWLAGREGAAGPSALGRGPGGWFAARLYLEAEGGRSQLLDRPFAGEVAAPVLAVTFPWRRLELDPDFSALRGWVRGGGTLVVGFSGREHGVSEASLLEVFGLTLGAARGPAPLGFLAWRRHLEEEWSLAPGPGLSRSEPAPGEEAPGAVAPAVLVSAVDLVPQVPAGAQILFERGPDAPGAIFSFGYGKGRVVVLPAEALSNARLRGPGNAGLLASLAAWLGPSWAFDEYHHGLVDRRQAAEEISLLPFDLFFVHLGLLYALGLWALARRFGPAWREPSVRAGSASSFLLGLGRLHDRLRHHPAAAKLLLARAREIDPVFAQAAAGRADLDEAAARADCAGLVELARRVAEMRGWRR